MATVAPADLARRIRAGRSPVVIDVRSPAEFAAGHVPDAINIPFWRFLVARVRVPASRESVVMYCGHGPRARIATAACRLRGLRDVVHLDGHWAAWRRDRLPQERGPARG